MILEDCPEGEMRGDDQHAGRYRELANAAQDWRPVSGWTHTFYRYPARFSPTFAAAAIANFSEPGQLVADPYMGGGTTVVEALAAGRDVIGNDLNALAAFVARVKTTRLTRSEAEAIEQWTRDAVPELHYRRSALELAAFIDEVKTKNLSISRARFIKKAVAGALASMSDLPTERSRDFVRCVLLRAGQWALDGRKRHTPLAQFRDRVRSLALEMLALLETFGSHIESNGRIATILNMDTALLPEAPVFRADDVKVDLVVTSPPYPGVHVLYHRWQVDGRRESPAPYWIAGCNDGQGASFYNFGDRRQGAADRYFRNSLLTLQAIRRVMRHGAHMVQLVAFNRPDEQLPRYLQNMEAAGFTEEFGSRDDRIWRHVPNRKWHANLRGRTSSSQEVVLVHRAS
jgi:DNA modification methylase